jgi:hypothetical protein
MTHRSLLDKILFVERSLQSLELTMKPSSRFDRMKRCFISADGSPRTVEPGDPDFETAIEALRDFTLLAFILEHQPSGVGRQQLQTVLKAALKDPVDPACALTAESRGNGRDTQAELFVAAMCERAALTPVELREPDVRCRHDGSFLGIAVKRPRSQENLPSVFADGAEQVRRSGFPGVLFVDVSLALNQSNERILRPMNDEEFDRVHALALHTWWTGHCKRLLPHLEGRGAFMLLIQNHVPRQIVGAGWQLGSAVMHVAVSDGTPSYQQSARRFARAFSHSTEVG